MSKRPLSIIFAGTPAFAVPALRALIEDAAFDVKLVITQPDKPVGRTHTLTTTPVKTFAKQHDIPVWQPENINGEWRLPAGKAGMANGDNTSQFPILNSPFDYLVVVAYGQILSQEILDSPAIAPVNVHFSLLPRWRGAAPVQHALLAGDKETGISIQKMLKKLDTGPVLAQMVVPIDGTKTAEQLYEDMSEQCTNLLLSTLKNPLHPHPQNENHARLGKKLSRTMGDVDPKTMTAEEIDRRVRALVPWPGVRAMIDGQEIKLLRTSLEASAQSAPLPCSDGILHLVSVQPAGGKPMSGASWKRGKR